jgi:predicted alpha/beta-fold hydrolase
VAALQRLFGGPPLQLVGFSLGGNFMLRVAAQASAAGLDLSRVIAVSPVLEPVATLAVLQQGMPGYERYFVRKWLRSLRKKQAAWPDVYDFAQLARARDLKLMTAELVRCYTDFPTLDHYLNGYAITGERLARLEVPSTILTSLDDPIIPASGLTRLARPPALSLTVTRYGGHCGFFDDLRGPTWLERRIMPLLVEGAGASVAGGEEVGAELPETS